MEEKLIHQSEMFKLGLGLDERGIEYRLYAENSGLTITTKYFDVFCHKECDCWQNGMLRLYDPVRYLGLESYSHFKDGMTAKDILDRIDEKISEKKDEVNE